MCLLSPTQPGLLRMPYPLNFHCGCFANLSSGKQLLTSASLFSLPDNGDWLEKSRTLAAWVPLTMSGLILDGHHAAQDTVPSSPSPSSSATSGAQLSAEGSSLHPFPERKLAVGSTSIFIPSGFKPPPSPSLLSVPMYEDGSLLPATLNSLPWAISLTHIFSPTSFNSVNSFSSGTKVLKSLHPKNTSLVSATPLFYSPDSFHSPSNQLIRPF